MVLELVSVLGRQQGIAILLPHQVAQSGIDAAGDTVSTLPAG